MSQSALTIASTSFIVVSGLSLLLGWLAIVRGKHVRRHKALMLAATGFAALFLVAYVTRWAAYGSKPFAGEGAWRAVYFANLVPHVVLAIAVGPLALWQIDLAMRRRDFEAHRRWGRVTAPVWLYVAASGWLVYWMLHRMAF